MIEKKIFLKTLEEVKEFVSVAMSRKYDLELLSGKYVVNAKSIMGVFSLDLTKPIVVVAHTDSDSELLAAIEKYEVAQHEKV